MQCQRGVSRSLTNCSTSPSTLNFNKLNFTNCFKLFCFEILKLHYLCCSYMYYCQQITYNVVVASYDLSEIPKTSLRQMAVRSLWGKTSDFLVSLYMDISPAKLTLLTCEVKRIIVYREMYHAIATR